MSIGERLRESREAAGYTPKAAAAEAERNGAKFGDGDILRWESGAHVPQLRNLTILGYIYGVTLDSLVADTEFANV